MQNEINKLFDKQIIQDEKYVVHKRLFNLTANFTIEDWRTIRTEKYWQTISLLKYDAQKEYTLQCVEYYLKTKTF